MTPLTFFKPRPILLATSDQEERGYKPQGPFVSGPYTLLFGASRAVAPASWSGVCGPVSFVPDDQPGDSGPEVSSNVDTKSKGLHL